MLSRRAFQLAAPVALLGFCSPAVLGAAQGHELFTLSRSKNKNIVKYAVRGVRAHQLEIEAYWLMLAENGRREDLTWTERQFAYGFSTSDAGDQACMMHLMACPDRALHVTATQSGYVARIAIARRHASLQRIFVCTDEHAIFPSVRYVEIFGITESGERVSERLLPRR